MVVNIKFFFFLRSRSYCVALSDWIFTIYSPNWPQIQRIPLVCWDSGHELLYLAGDKHLKVIAVWRAGRKMVNTIV